MSRALIRVTAACAGGLALAVSTGAAALNWQLGEVGVDLNTRVSSGVALRTDNADPIYVGIANGGRAYSNNGDDGDLAFGGAGSVVDAPQKLNSALTLSWHQFGVFARATYLYDPVLDYKDFFNRASYGPGKEYGYDVLNAKEGEVRGHVGNAGAILDLYAYGNFELGGHSLSVKLGKQIVNWGESTLVLNGLNSLVSFNASKARIPGAELSEFVVPVPQVFASYSMTTNISVEGFYQWKSWATIPDAAGTFYAIPDQDFAGFAGNAGDISFGRAPENSLPGTDCSTTGGNNPTTPTTCVPFGGTIPRGAPRLPKNGGQFGGALRLQLPQLNDTELAFYAASYASRLPVYSTISASSGNVSSQTARYFDEYPGNIRMYGVSFNASLPWGLAFQGEYSFKPDVPLQLNSVEVNLSTLGAPSQINPVAGQTLGNQYIRGWRSKQISQVDFGLTKILGGSNWLHYDQLILLAELAGDRVHNLESTSTLRYEGPATYLPGDPNTAAFFGVPQQVAGFPTANSWGYKLVAHATYNNVFTGITLEPGLRFDHDVGGITPLPLNNFVKNSRMLAPSLGWRYLSDLTGEIGYHHYFGGGQTNLLRDRDYVEAFIRYAF